LKEKTLLAQSSEEVSPTLKDPEELLEFQHSELRDLIREHPHHEHISPKEQ
jgi:hypothetical protein